MDQNYLGGGDQAEYLLPPYPPYRCTCAAGWACPACRAWGKSQRLHGPQPGGDPGGQALSDETDALDWRTHTPQVLYAQIVLMGRQRYAQYDRPPLWSRDQVLLCGLAWMRLHAGQVPQWVDCTQREGLPTQKVYSRFFGTMVGFQQALQQAWEEAV